MSFAFVSQVPSGSFIVSNQGRSLTSSKSSKCSTTPKMSANWPDDTGPAYEKYLSRFPMDRLNKAPVITINQYPDPAYNSVSVRLGDMLTDIGEGDSLKAGVVIDEEQPPAQSKWEKYYDPATVNEAPFISIYGSSNLPMDKHAICWVQTTVPVSLPTARVLLGDVEPDPELYEDKYIGRLNIAPIVQLDYNSSDDDSIVSVENVYQPLNIVAANAILSQYKS